MAAYHPPWQHEFRLGVPCLFCGTSEHPTLTVAGATAGVCEACTAHAHWVWKTLSGDSVPVDRPTRVGRVKVVISRLAMLALGEEAVTDHPASYEILMSCRDGGDWDLPSADVQEGETELSAVDRALAAVGIASWPAYVYPLYASYTPRGGLARLYVVKAYTVITPDKTCQWKGWPPWKHARGLAGLYLGMADVWPLLIAQHYAEEPHASQVTTLVREGATKYLNTQLSLVSGAQGLDTSMLKLLRESMSDDERLICKQVVAAATLEHERVSEVAAAPPSSPEAEYVEGGGGDEGEGDELDEDLGGSEGTIEDAFHTGPG